MEPRENHSEMPAITAPQTARTPRRPLWVLATLVTLIHWLVLADNPLSMGLSPAPEPLQTQKMVFNTRQIEVPRPAPRSASLRPAPARKAKSATPAKPAKPAVSPEAPAPASSAAETVVASAPAPADTAPAATVDAAPNAAPATATPANPEPAAAAAPAAGSDKPEPQVAAKLDVPASVRLKYDMVGLARGLTYHAGGVMTWKREGNRYEASMVVSAFLLGSRTLSSVGEVTADGIAPKRFGDKGRRGEQAVHFDAEKGKIIFSTNRPEQVWRRGAQDQVSVFFQLAALLAGETGGLPPGTRLPMYTVGPRDADTWAFTVGELETLNLPMGEIKAIRVARDPRREFDQKVEAWFAPSLNYWPVRIRLTQGNGDFVDQLLSSSGSP